MILRSILLSSVYCITQHAQTENILNLFYVVQYCCHQQIASHQTEHCTDLTYCYHQQIALRKHRKNTNRTLCTDFRYVVKFYCQQQIASCKHRTLCIDITQYKHYYQLKITQLKHRTLCVDCICTQYNYFQQQIALRKQRKNTLH